MAMTVKFGLARGLLAGWLALVVAGCASRVENAPLNRPTSAAFAAETHSVNGDDALKSTIVGLAFSGGGTRASAFSFGVLRGLARIDTSGGGNYLEQVRFVSGVSGGSITAAYFGLRGPNILSDFEARFLYRDAEEGLRTTVYSPENLARALDSGVNDRSNFPKWLSKNLFGNATFGDLNRPGRPTVWINASDIYSKTPFIFEPVTFGAICSDLASYPVAEAVAASAAVPIVFAPTVVESYAERCNFQMPEHLTRAGSGREASPTAKAYLDALKKYRDPQSGKFIKLLDGGLTDNWGLQGVNVALASSPEPWKPLSREDAIALTEFLFVVVDAGRLQEGDWTRTLEGPSGSELLNAVTDTAVDSAVRSSFEVFRLQMQMWQERLRSWRCGLPSGDVEAVRGSLEGWDCRAVSIRVRKVSFEDLGRETAQKLGRIPTRLKLAPEQVKAAIDAGEQAIRKMLAEDGRG